MPASHTTSAPASCWAFSVLLLLAGCFQPGKPISSVDIVERSGKLDKKKLEDRALKLADRLKGFDVRKAKPQEEEYQLTLRVYVAAERAAIRADGNGPLAGQMHRGARVELALLQLKGGRSKIKSEAAVEKDVPENTPPEAIAFEALEEAMKSIGSGIELAEANDAEIVAAIGSSDLALRRRAIVMAGDRQLKEALPALSELVRNEKEDDHELVLTAIGALVAIGDDRAVPALIDAGARRSSAYLSQILFAVAQLGGRQAEGYLLTVSNGHADPEVRKNASDALEELEHKRDEKSP